MFASEVAAVEALRGSILIAHEQLRTARDPQTFAKTQFWPVIAQCCEEALLHAEDALESQEWDKCLNLLRLLEAVLQIDPSASSHNSSSSSSSSSPDKLAKPVKVTKDPLSWLIQFGGQNIDQVFREFEFRAMRLLREFEERRTQLVTMSNTSAIVIPPSSVSAARHHRSRSPSPSASVSPSSSSSSSSSARMKEAASSSSPATTTTTSTTAAAGEGSMFISHDEFARREASTLPSLSDRLPPISHVRQEAAEHGQIVTNNWVPPSPFQSSDNLPGLFAPVGGVPTSTSAAATSATAEESSENKKVSPVKEYVAKSPEEIEKENNKNNSHHQHHSPPPPPPQQQQQHGKRRRLSPPPSPSSFSSRKNNNSHNNNKSLGRNVKPDGRSFGFQPRKLPMIQHEWYNLYTEERKTSHKAFIAPPVAAAAAAITPTRRGATIKNQQEGFSERLKTMKINRKGDVFKVSSEIAEKFLKCTCGVIQSVSKESNSWFSKSRILSRATEFGAFLFHEHELEYDNEEDEEEDDYEEEELYEEEQEEGEHHHQQQHRHGEEEEEEDHSNLDQTSEPTTILNDVSALASAEETKQQQQQQDQQQKVFTPVKPSSASSYPHHQQHHHHHQPKTKATVRQQRAARAASERVEKLRRLRKTQAARKITKFFRFAKQKCQDDMETLLLCQDVMKGVLEQHRVKKEQEEKRQERIMKRKKMKQDEEEEEEKEKEAGNEQQQQQAGDNNNKQEDENLDLEPEEEEAGGDDDDKKEGETTEQEEIGEDNLEPAVIPWGQIEKFQFSSKRKFHPLRMVSLSEIARVRAKEKEKEKLVEEEKEASRRLQVMQMREELNRKILAIQRIQRIGRAYLVRSEIANQLATFMLTGASFARLSFVMQTAIAAREKATQIKKEDPFEMAHNEIMKRILKKHPEWEKSHFNWKRSKLIHSVTLIQSTLRWHASVNVVDYQTSRDAVAQLEEFWIRKTREKELKEKAQKEREMKTLY